MGFGTLGFWEIAVIAIVVLVFFGPRRLPEIGRSVGKTLREFRRGMNEVKREFEEVERMGSLEKEGEAGEAGGRSRPRGRVRPPASPPEREDGETDEAANLPRGPAPGVGRPTEGGADEVAEPEPGPREIAADPEAGRREVPQPEDRATERAEET